MWYNNGDYGFRLYILQIKLIDNIIDNNKYIFLENTSSNTNIEPDSVSNTLEITNDIPIKEDERFKKYFKMLSYKIPIQSIK